MEPQDRRGQWVARNAAMREQVGALLDGLTRQTAALRAAQARAARLTGRASSPDGLVTVTVNAAGVVTDVGFAASAFTRSTPEKLARSVAAAAQQAAAEARRQVEALMAPVQGDLPDLPDVFPGAPPLKDLLPTPPARDPRPPEDDEDFSTRSVLRGGDR